MLLRSDPGLLLLGRLHLRTEVAGAVLGGTGRVGARIGPTTAREAVPAGSLLLLQLGHLGQHLEVTRPGGYRLLEQVILLDHNLFVEVFLVRPCFDLLAVEVLVRGRR